MRRLLHHYQVDPSFLRVVFSFGEEPHVAESGSSFLSIRSDPDSPKTEISYQLNYVEENRRKGYDPWSFRHTGVYHGHALDSDLFIILYPTQDSILESHLLSILGINLIEVSMEPVMSAKLVNDPYRLHSLVLCSFLDNWRWYFRFLGENFKFEVFDARWS